jgi:spore maturation protein CgeB
MPWYAANRDLANPSFCTTLLYNSFEDLQVAHRAVVQYADLVIVGSYVPEGVNVGKWVTETAEGVTAFYDIDTPVTLAKLEKKDFEYLHPDLISHFDMYLSFTGGPTLNKIERQYGSPMARAFYCSFDPELYYPDPQNFQWDLGYLGTYSDDRQPPLQQLMLEAAGQLSDLKFVVAGPQYPKEIEWPHNIERIEHLPPAAHRRFYNSQRFTMNITRADMIRAGYSPSVRLFEAAACGTPIISDYWEGIETIFEVESEILISQSAEDTIRYLATISEEERGLIGERARQRVFDHHTAAHRASELENYFKEAICTKKARPQTTES